MQKLNNKSNAVREEVAAKKAAEALEEKTRIARKAAEELEFNRQISAMKRKRVAMAVMGITALIGVALGGAYKFGALDRFLSSDEVAVDASGAEFAGAGDATDIESYNAAVATIMERIDEDSECKKDIEKILEMRNEFIKTGKWKKSEVNSVVKDFVKHAGDVVSAYDLSYIETGAQIFIYNRLRTYVYFDLFKKHDNVFRSYYGGHDNYEAKRTQYKKLEVTVKAQYKAYLKAKGLKRKVYKKQSSAMIDPTGGIKLDGAFSDVKVVSSNIAIDLPKEFATAPGLTFKGNRDTV